MKLLQNPKFTGPALILLLALNTTLLVFILFRHPGPPPFPGGHPGPRDLLVHELKMDEKQQNAYDALIKTHRSSVDMIQENIRQERDSLITLLGNTSADQQTVNSLSERIGNNQKQLEVVTFRHFTEVRKICTPEQQKKFDEIIHEALRMMGPPPQPPGK